MSLLSFHEIGNSSGQPLLFLHGLGASFKQTTSALTDLPGIRLIAPDMPGHGESLDFDPETFSFDSFADHVITLLDHLGIESTDLGGLSMGSGIALNLALRYPERIKKIIVLRPSWLDSVEPEHLHLVARVGQWLKEFGEDTTTQKLAMHPDYQTLVEENVSVATSLTALLDRPRDAASTEVLFRMWQSRPFENISSLRQIGKPALVLDTTRDELHPQSIAQKIADQITDGQVITLPPRYYEETAYKNLLNESFRNFLL